MREGILATLVSKLNGLRHARKPPNGLLVMVDGVAAWHGVTASVAQH